MISVETVRTHTSNVRIKLELPSKRIRMMSRQWRSRMGSPQVPIRPDTTIEIATVNTEESGAA
jgi:hypothetical protein